GLVDQALLGGVVADELRADLLDHGEDGLLDPQSACPLARVRGTWSRGSIAQGSRPTVCVIVSGEIVAE
ncbi:hypothetical protein ACFC0D_38210, partial [Streptomyces sp. NPDC056222]|uniref:hypothetical protein n=1 Tax=Streptomyces sp. NPDC056222 TaxID=3345749 RepID=UPI0035D8F61B